MYVFQVHVAMEPEMTLVGASSSAAAAVSAPSDGGKQSSDTVAEPRLVYMATAADTSCVGRDDDNRQRPVVGVSDVSAHMIVDIDNSDSDTDDDDDETGGTRHNMSSTATRRN